MSLVAVHVADGDFECSCDDIVRAIMTGRAKLLLIAKSTPTWLSAQLMHLADIWHCPHMSYAHSLIKILNSHGIVVRTRYIVFTDAKAASDILTLAS